MIQPFIKTISVSLLFLLFSGCVSVKIKAHPSYLGFYEGEVILLATTFQGVPHSSAIYFSSWSKKMFSKNLPLLKYANYEDCDFLARQFGISLAEVEVMNPHYLKSVYEKVGVNYMLVNQLKLKSNSLVDFNSPDYLVREANLQLQLIDLKNAQVIWTCESKVQIAPLIIKDDDRTYPYNLSSSVSAFDKAYRKSIKRLIKSFHLIQVK